MGSSTTYSVTFKVSRSAKGPEGMGGGVFPSAQTDPNLANNSPIANITLG